MRLDFKVSTVYILDPDCLLDINKRTVGTGFVVSSDGLIATCAHVASQALSDERVHLIFFNLSIPKEEREIRTSRLEPAYFRDAEAEDLALLRLEGPLPREVIPLPLGRSFNTQGQSFLSFGFPASRPEDGLLGECKVLGMVSDANLPLLQISSNQVSKGFSGAPVWSEKLQAVIGMITSIVGTRKVKIASTDILLPFDPSGRQTDTAFATPVESLLKVCPLLQRPAICPYRGLDAFTEEHTSFFFGREQVIERLVNRLKQDVRFMAVLGPSGSGKSSIMQAGLMPQLRRGMLGDSDRWGLIFTRPADDPFKQLTTRGLAVEAHDLTESVQAWQAQHAQQTRLVLIIDQFEELLTICPEALRHNFITQLISLLKAPLPITVIVVLRDDFYNQFARQETLVEWLERSQGPVNVPQTLKREEVSEIVQKPADAVGLRFEEGLVETIVHDAMETTPSSADEGRVARSTILPLLEFTLTQLWEQCEEGMLSRKAYDAIGGVTGGVTQWADHAFYSLANDEQRRIARRIFTDLIHIGDKKQGVPDSRRRMSLAALCRNEQETEEVSQVAQQLANNRLLVMAYDLQSKQDMVEIIHDALLWEWGLLKQWLQEDRSFLAWHQELKRRVQAWVETNERDLSRRDEYKLFGGSDLEEAMQWSQVRSAELSQVERDFIQAAQQRQRQEEQLRKLYEQQKIRVGRRKVLLGIAGVGLAAAGIGGATWWWQSQLQHYKTLITYHGHKNSVWGVAWSSDATLIASASADQTVQVWFANTGRHIYTYSGHIGGVTGVSWSPDSYSIASASYDKTVQVWNPDGIRTPFIYRNHTDLVLAVAWSPDGRHIASSGSDRTVQVWNPIDGGDVLRYHGHKDSIRAVAWSPDSKRIASGSGDRTVQIWDPSTGNQFLKYIHSSHVLSVAWSHDGTRIASAGLDSTVQVWNATNGIPIYTYHGHLDAVVGVAWSPDDKLIASASNDKTVLVWHVADGSLVCKYQGHTAVLENVAWSPRDSRIVSVGNDRTAQVWQVV